MASLAQIETHRKAHPAWVVLPQAVRAIARETLKDPNVHNALMAQATKLIELNPNAPAEAIFQSVVGRVQSYVAVDYLNSRPAGKRDLDENYLTQLSAYIGAENLTEIVLEQREDAQKAAAHLEAKEDAAEEKADDQAEEAQRAAAVEAEQQQIAADAEEPRLDPVATDESKAESTVTPSPELESNHQGDALEAVKGLLAEAQTKGLPPEQATTSPILEDITRNANSAKEAENNAEKHISSTSAGPTPPSS